MLFKRKEEGNRCRIPSPHRYFVYCMLLPLKHLRSDSRFPLCLHFREVLRKGSLTFLFNPKPNRLSAPYLLRFPKSLYGLERRAILTAAPSSPRFISHRERFGDDATVCPTSGPHRYEVLKKQTCEGGHRGKGVSRGERALCLLWRSNVPK